MPALNVTSLGWTLAFTVGLGACRDVITEDGGSNTARAGSSVSSTTGEAAGGSTAAATSSSSGVGGASVTACPAAAATATGTNTVVRIDSSEPIDPTSTNGSSLEVLVDGGAVPGAVNADTHGLTFVPQEPLPSNHLVEVVLSPTVHDENGHALTDILGSTWSFTTANGPAPDAGFVFTDPLIPPNGDFGLRFELAMDGDHPILAWGSSLGLVASEHDGSSFTAPLDVANGAAPNPDQVALAVSGGRAHFGWTYFDGPGTIFYDHADLPFAPPGAAPMGMSAASYQSRLAADGNRVAMVWEVDTFVIQDWGFRYTTSSDGGATWAQPIVIDPMSRCVDVAYVDGFLVLVWTSGMEIGDHLLAAASSDNGLTFGAPVTLATSATQLWCPVVADNGNGAAVIAFEDGSGTGARSANITSFAPAMGTAGPVTQLAAPDDAEVCVNLAASPSTGRVVFTRSRGHAFMNDFVTELYASEDAGSTFGAKATVDVLKPDEACPELGYAPSGDVHLAWLRSDYALLWSHGRPKRPCE